MHGTTLTRTQRTRRTSARNHGTRPLKNWLSRYRTPRHGTHRPGWRTGLCDRCHRTRWRRFVHRTRPGLRNDHARRRRLRRTCNHWCCGTRRCRWNLGSGGRRNRRRRWRRRRNHCGRSRRRRGTRRRHSRRRDCNHARSGGWNHGSRWLLRWGRNHFWSRSRGRRFRCRNHRRRRRRCRSWRWRRNHRLGGDRRRCRTSWWRHSFLLLRDSFQHVSRAGDMRQIDLGLDFFFAAQWTRGPGRRRLRFGRAAEVHPHLFRFMLLERTGMRLLLSHPDKR